MLKKILALAGLSTSALSAHAVLLYDEAVHGDMVWNGSYNTAVDLEMGRNIIRGSQFYKADGLDFDSFIFNIAEFLQLDKIYLEFSNVDRQRARASVNWGIRQNPVSLFNGTYLGGSGQVTVNDTAGPANLFVDEYFGTDLELLPLGQGSYAFVQGLGASFFSGDTDWGVSWDYSIEFVVTSTEVPVPATVWLFGSALSVLVGVKRQK